MIQLSLTEAEADVLLGGSLGMAIHYARDLLDAGSEPNEDDYHTLWLYQSIGKKLQREVGMPDATLFAILAAAYGKLDPRVQKLLIEAQRRCGGRE